VSSSHPKTHTFTTFATLFPSLQVGANTLADAGAKHGQHDHREQRRRKQSKQLLMDTLVVRAQLEQQQRRGSCDNLLLSTESDTTGGGARGGAVATQQWLEQHLPALVDSAMERRMDAVVRT
jgi:hypothetical protein